MYKIGDYVVKPSSGVCKVDNIMHLDMTGIDRNRLYYLLVPVNDEKGKKNTVADENYLNLAEKMLFSELCLVLGKNKDEVHNLIAESVNKRGTN